MLAKKYHLPTSFFTSLKQKRKISVSGDVFCVSIFDSPNTFSRFAVIISTKVSKKSTVRNKIKRILFEYFRTRKKFEIIGKDFVFYVNTKIISFLKSEVEEKLDDFFKKIK